MIVDLSPLIPERPMAYDGDFDSPDELLTRIEGTVQIGGRWFHYVAIQVDCLEDGGIYAVNSSLDPDIDRLIELLGDCPATTEIDGRRYVEFFLPFTS